MYLDGGKYEELHRNAEQRKNDRESSTREKAE
jgi:hypothetical protein